MEKRKSDKLENRKTKFLKMDEEFKNNGYHTVDLSVDGNTANWFSLLTPLPVILVLLLLFTYRTGWKILLSANLEIVLIAFFISIIVHELIHGFFFGIFAKQHFKAIEFGVLWKSLNPYCYCSEPVNKWQYLIALLAPGTILGLFVGTYAIVIKSPTWFLFSVLSLFAAGGDFLVAFKLLKFKTRGKEVAFVDHPEKPGLLAYER